MPSQNLFRVVALAVSMAASALIPVRAHAQGADDPFGGEPTPARETAPRIPKPQNRPKVRVSQAGTAATGAPRPDDTLPNATPEESRAARRSNLPVESADKNPDVADWITELASPVAATREAATKSLINAGPRVMPKLRHALVSDDREVRARAEAVAHGLEAKGAAYLNGRVGVKVYVEREVPDNVVFDGADVTLEDVRQLACLYRIRRLAIYRAHVTDDLLECVAQLVSLEILGFVAADITDADIARLRPLPYLTSIGVGESKISGRGLASLAGLPSLQTVAVSHCPLRDDAVSDSLKILGREAHLQNLYLMDCPISDAVMKRTAEIATLKRLNLGGTKITDAGLVHLSACHRLIELALGDTSVTDTGLAELSELPRLRKLRLTGTGVTSQGLLRLRKMPSLREVTVDRSVFGPEGSAQLRKELPHVTITVFSAR